MFLCLIVQNLQQHFDPIVEKANFVHLLCPDQYAVDNRNQDDGSRLISPDDEYLSWWR